MTTEKMTVHKALAELKTMDARIEKAIRDTTYVLAVKHSAEKINGMPVANFKEKMRSGYQKVTDLIARRNAMKRAVVLSNANTKVKVGDKEMTVAEAIEQKNHGMEFRSELLRQISSAYALAQKELDRNSGETLEKKALRKTYIENNTYDLVDPLDVTKIMEELDAEINEFNAEVDAALSVSNALTVIEFEY